MGWGRGFLSGAQGAVRPEGSGPGPGGAWFLPSPLGRWEELRGPSPRPGDLFLSLSPLTS